MDGAVRPGDLVGGKYLIERLLGQGGMGAVYVALQERLGRRVAIKFLHPNGLRSEEALARFEREARASAALESDHVTRVLDVGHLDSGAPYIVMELLDGEDLGAAVERRGALPIVEAVDVIIQACDAIGEAHRHGIVHRDLKPANIFLARRSNGSVTAKVLDFGISKTADATAGVGLTSSVALMGSPRYMSPEQLREARNVDGRADIWALGITLYELLAVQPPFDAEALAELCAQILTAQPRPLRGFRPDVPVGLEAIILRCLFKDPSGRFANVDELVAALKPFSTPGFAAAPNPASQDDFSLMRTVAAPEMASAVMTASPVTSSQTTPLLASTTSTRRVGRGMMGAGVGVVAAIALLLGVFWPRRAPISPERVQASSVLSNGSLDTQAPSAGPTVAVTTVPTTTVPATPELSMPSPQPPGTIASAAAPGPSANTPAPPAGTAPAIPAHSAGSRVPRPGTTGTTGGAVAAPSGHARTNPDPAAPAKASNPLDLEFK